MKRFSAFVLAFVLVFSLSGISFAVDSVYRVVDNREPFIYEGYVLVDHPDGSYDVYAPSLSSDSDIMPMATIPTTSLAAVAWGSYNSVLFYSNVYMNGGFPYAGIAITANGVATASSYCGYAFPANEGDIVTVVGLAPIVDTTFVGTNNSYTGNYISYSPNGLYYYWCNYGTLGTYYNYFTNSSPDFRTGATVTSVDHASTVVNNQVVHTFKVSQSLGWIAVTSHPTSPRFGCWTNTGTGNFDVKSLMETLVDSVDSRASEETLLALLELNKTLATESTSQKILAAIQTLVQGQGALTPMEQFEAEYLDKFHDQLSKTDNALSPSNPALPNGGDIGGFVTDVSEGLGITGSSFTGQEFNAATGGFTGNDSTGIGGPWEFFTQGVADDLSGDSPAGIDTDYDPILAWVEDSERWLKSWGSYNP